MSRSISGHSGAQVNNIFNAAGQGGHATDNAVIVVSAEHEIFSYAAVIDNNTTDPIFVRGAEDAAPQGSPANRTVQVGENGLVFTDSASHSNMTEIHLGDTVTWVWNGSTMHGVTSGTCQGGGGGGGGYASRAMATTTARATDGSVRAPITARFEFSHTFTEAGTFAYYCPVHGAAMNGTSGRRAPPRRRPRPAARSADGFRAPCAAAYSATE